MASVAKGRRCAGLYPRWHAARLCVQQRGHVCKDHTLPALKATPRATCASSICGWGALEQMLQSLHVYKAIGQGSSLLLVLAVRQLPTQVYKQGTASKEQPPNVSFYVVSRVTEQESATRCVISHRH